MGEIAEMMLDGCMCQLCGEFLGDGDSFPVVCEGCQSQHGVDQFGERRGGKKREAASGKPLQCTCGRRFGLQEAMTQHRRAKNCPPPR